VPKTLALIHTSMVFLTVETMMQDILAQVLPDVRLINIVDDSLLPDVMASGQISPAVTRRMCAYVVAAEMAGADAALSLCSSLGPTVDVARELVSIPVVKIDDAMTEKAAREADRIGVMATVETTLGPTVDLIEEKAAAMDKRIQVYRSLVKGAFEALMSGDKDQHDAMVSAAAQDLTSKVDMLVLAQASMTRLAPRLQQETRLPVLTSPRLGIEYTRRVLDELG
jgi:Asp/Glu/hydantoin racemase